ncbi:MULTISPECIES: DEAD/DEAH box helicase [Giesbergeria]|uniref:SNF2-related protein n=1 Tax=Giesbergeria sinuosa TaxID=80883 RepID=A0ABV9QBG6_9BURK
MSRFVRPSSAQAPWIPLTTIAHGAGHSTGQRGQELYRQGAILAFDIEALDDHWQVFGQVQGSATAPYTLSIEVHVDMTGQPYSWESECSCPVGHQCKHAVALLLHASHHGHEAFPDIGLPGTIRLSPEALQAERAASEESVAEQQRQQQATARALIDTQWLQWLHTLEQSHPRTAPTTANHPPQRADCFLYLLALAVPEERTVPDADRLPMLCLHLVQSYPKKAGGWAKVRHLNHLPLPSDPLYQQASEDDRTTVELLRSICCLPQRPAQPSQQHASSPTGHRILHEGVVLQGPMVASALQHAASTKRLFLTQTDGQPGMPVQWGEAHTAQWSWKTKDIAPTGAAPLWQLQAVAVQEGMQLCANQPPLYLDAAHGLCGPVHMPGFTPAQLAVLLQAPPASETLLKQHQRTLIEQLGHLPLPAVVQDITVLRGVSPQAQLHLSPTPAPQQGQLGMLSAQLRFDYQGLSGWWPTAQATVLVEATAGQTNQVLLHRDLAAEQHAMAQLLGLGLTPLGDHGQFQLGHAAGRQQWLQWLDEDFATLRTAGFQITTDTALQQWIIRADQLNVRLQPEGIPPGLEDSTEAVATSPWFELSLGIEIDGQRHNILPLLPEIIATVAHSPTDPQTGQRQLPPFLFVPAPHRTTGFLRLPTAALQPWLAALFDLVGDRQHDFTANSLRLSRMDALRTSAALGEGAVWAGATALHSLVQQLHHQSPLPDVPLPTSVQAQLRPYQQQGLNWLQFLRHHGLGGILADDMGLGKTLQTLVHIQVEKEAGRLTVPALIIAPVSLMGNWQREAARFCPQLRSLVLHGKDRHAVVEDIADCDLVIAPYSLLQRDRKRWLAQHWHLVVLDEAQNIKNASTQAAQVVGELQTRHRLCLSGTPMENHLGEIWSLFHFLMPGFLGSQKRFTEIFRQPIEKWGDSTRLAQLRARVTPFMLRRTKALVAADLPPKVETVMRIELAGPQANLYETIRLTMEASVRDALETQGLAKSQLTILDALLKLRQVCCAPQLVPLEAARKVPTSAKLEYLMEILPEMLAEGRRILLFSQFTSMLALIEAELEKRQLPWVKLTGQSQKRDDIIQQFTSGQVPLFLISLKAGGVGLNLPQADTVIHYDPWWNPAVENQATDRAHRIGQTQSVWVVKLVAQGTIEERILALQERKAQLADSMYSGATARQEPMFTANDVAELLKPLAP